MKDKNFINFLKLFFGKNLNINCKYTTDFSRKQIFGFYTYTIGSEHCTRGYTDYDSIYNCIHAVNCFPLEIQNFDSLGGIISEITELINTLRSDINFEHALTSALVAFMLIHEFREEEFAHINQYMKRQAFSFIVLIQDGTVVHSKIIDSTVPLSMFDIRNFAIELVRTES